jgi:transposase
VAAGRVWDRVLSAIQRQADAQGRLDWSLNRLKQWRRIATRYEKRASNYLAMLTLAAIVLWL